MGIRHRLLFSILLLLSGSTLTRAQEYNWKAPVAPAPEKGYYRILLSPEVRGNLQADLSDVRLMNEQQQEVPYLLRSEQPVQYKKLFKPYTILHYNRKKDCCSELLIENTNKRKIDNISLLIKNADVRKQVHLSGSDDRENWFVLKAQDVLHTLNSTESTARLRLLEFPLNDYRYLRLQLNDSSSALSTSCRPATTTLRQRPVSTPPFLCNKSPAPTAPDTPISGCNLPGLLTLSNWK
ncbi:hypothetical protein DXT99_20700 [Pontibacter diazotrophicus]|uniref:DUF3999 family protein n=1 Tax=Pontibacter diazotrophicus TaxID=1400979 RepID=A0A3D8L6Y5_9BACT|nr:hypothetical protein [Pontibacter diazotrophicus]RDV13169.1 hypothetical protein DXT99_20700 [Pontibacter diazotrophicus]